MAAPLIHLLRHQEWVVAKSIHTVFQRSYRIEADLIGVKDFPPLHRAVSNFQKSTTHFFGYREEEELAAVVEINYDDEHLEICSLVVGPDFFRQGIASKIMQFVLEEFPRPLSMVETATANQPAISLYEKYGFELKKKWMLEIGIEKVKMTRRN